MAPSVLQPDHVGPLHAPPRYNAAPGQEHWIEAPPKMRQVLLRIRFFSIRSVSRRRVMENRLRPLPPFTIHSQLAIATITHSKK